MKKFRFEWDEENQIEGVFDEQDEIITAWCANDADWRQEYFSPLVRFLDGVCLPPQKAGRNQRIAAMRDYLDL